MHNLLLLSLSTLALSTQLGAQVTREQQRQSVRVACNETSTIVRQGPPYSPAHFGALRGCGDSGPAVLARFLERPRTNDTVVLSSAFEVASSMPDKRILGVLLRVLEDSAATPLDQSTAVAIMATYLEPRSRPRLASVDGSPDAMRAISSRVSHGSAVKVSMPLTGSDLAMIREKLADVALGATDQYVRRFAATILKRESP